MTAMGSIGLKWQLAHVPVWLGALVVVALAARHREAQQPDGVVGVVDLAQQLLGKRQDVGLVA